MGEQEKLYCRNHFHNYTGRTAFDTKIFDREYDYVCMSFHDDFALELHQSKQFPQMRIVSSNSKSGSFTPVLNLNDEEKQEWLSENFVSMGHILPERFREKLEWIDKHLSEKTRLVLMTGPEYDYFCQCICDADPLGLPAAWKLEVRDFCHSETPFLLVLQQTEQYPDVRL